MSVVLAFCGGIASGKSTLSRAVADRLGWPRASFGEHIRRLAAARGVDPGDPLALQEIGDSLAREQPEALCRAVMGEAGWSSPASIVLDGLRHAHVLDVLSHFAAPSRVATVFVDVPRDVRAGRFRRRLQRGPALGQLECHRVEADVLGTLRTRADLRVDGTGDLESSVRRVAAWARGLSTGTSVGADCTAPVAQ